MNIHIDRYMKTESKRWGHRKLGELISKRGASGRKKSEESKRYIDREREDEKDG